MSFLRAAHGYVSAWIPNRDARALLFQAIVALAIAFVIGTVLYRRVPSSPAWARANTLSRNGNFEAAEEAYWEYIQKGPVTVPLLVDFLDNHGVLTTFASLGEDATKGLDMRRQRVVVTDDQIEKLLDGDTVSRDAALLGRYWWELGRHSASDALRRQVVAAADAEPPTPWANHILAKDALHSGKLDEQAKRLEREGLAFPERKSDAHDALHIWLMLKEWDVLEQKLADPRYKGIADPWLRHEVALHAGDWKAAARWLVAAFFDEFRADQLGLAAITALMWGLFCARLGKLRDRPLFRGAMYTVAFFLGMASVIPTLGLIVLEENFLHVKEGGGLARDAVYYIGGVGFREEACKLFAFSLLLPILRKWGTRLDVLACGAMVGLGFAAEENLGYFERGSEAVALGRFLTANFMHISMTAICADALDEWIRAPGEHSFEFSRAFLTVIALHGAYDFFASYVPYLSIVIFVLLTRQFLHAVSTARGRPDPEDKFLRRFVQAVIVVLAASFVYACARAGPSAAAAVLAIGLIGDAIIVYMFIQEMRRAG